MDIDRRIEIAILVKYYGNLLTNKQREIINMYVDNNLSFHEVSVELNISRQAVKDALDKAVSTMENYEIKLKFIARDNKIKDVLNELDEKTKTKILAILEGN